MILSDFIKESIRLDYAVWLAKQARKHRCNQTDVVEASKTQPPHASQAPAAPAPAAAPVSAETAEEAVTISSATELPPPAKRPVPLPAMTSFTLSERVRARHLQHPTWTARMIATDLGANERSVSTYLAAIKSESLGEPPTAKGPEVAVSLLPNVVVGSVEAQLRADAVARKARLGARK